MPTSERDALKAAIAASKKAIVRKPSPLDLVDELDALTSDTKRGS